MSKNFKLNLEELCLYVFVFLYMDAIDGDVFVPLNGISKILFLKFYLIGLKYTNQVYSQKLRLTHMFFLIQAIVPRFDRSEVRFYHTCCKFFIEKNNFVCVRDTKME